MPKKQDKHLNKEESPSSEPKKVYSVVIDAFDNGSSRHSFPNVIPLEIIRDLLFRHMMLVQDQITRFHCKEDREKVQIVRPNQIPPLKLIQ